MRKIIASFICGLMVVTNVLADTSVTTYGPTTSSDTIWSIAGKLRPSPEVSISQVVMGIFNHNKQAFYRNNINALDDGKIIHLPDIETIRNIDEHKANKEIALQNRKWEQRLAKNRGHHKTDLGKNRAENTEQLQNQPSTAILAPATEPLPPVTPQLVLDPSSQINNAPQVNSLAPAQQPFGSQNSVTAGSTLSSDEITKGLVNRLADAEAKNNAAQTQIAQLSERVNSLEKNINELTTPQQNGSKNFISNFLVTIQHSADQLSDYLGPQLFIAIVIALVIILLLLLIYLIVPRRKDSSADYPQDNLPNKKEESDPLACNEGTAAKLNLARAYLEMGQESKAQTLLYEVLSHGTDGEQTEANALLKKIKNNEL